MQKFYADIEIDNDDPIWVDIKAESLVEAGQKLDRWIEEQTFLRVAGWGEPITEADWRDQEQVNYEVYFVSYHL